MSETRNFRFDRGLLSHIEVGRNDEAKSMVNEDLCSAVDDYGTLLHYAANYANYVFIRYLLELGMNVDSQESELSQTPIMIAVDINSGITVKALLEAGANIDITNTDGKSALQLALDVDHFDMEVVQAFFDRLRSENLSTEDFAERLIKAKCPLYHAAYLRDIKVMEHLLKRGIDVNSEGYEGKTALFAAVELDDPQLMEMLIDNGADVNAFDEDDLSVLFYAVTEGNSEIVQLLMQEFAYPDAKDPETGCTPLFHIFNISTVETQEKHYKCAVLLLRHGANLPRRSKADEMNLFQSLARKQCYDLIKLIIAHIVLTTVFVRRLPKINGCCEDEEQRWMSSHYEDYYRNCTRILKISLVGKLTLLDFFDYQEQKIRVCMHDERLNNELIKVYAEQKLSEDYPYYFEIISERVKQANLMVKLEKHAIAILMEIFNNSFGHSKGECFVIAEQVVGYLNDYYIKELCQVN